MTICKISYDDFCRSLQAAVNNTQADHRKLEAALKKMRAFLPPEDGYRADGLRITISDEEEIDSLLAPLLRAIETPMAALVTVPRDIAVSVLSKLSLVRRNTACALWIPLDRDQGPVNIHLLPVAKNLQELYSVHGLAAHIFPRNWTLM